MKLLAALAVTIVLVGCTGGGDDAEVRPTTSAVDIGPRPEASTIAPDEVAATTVPSTTSVPEAATVTRRATTSTSTVPAGGGIETGALEDADVQIETEDGRLEIGVADVPPGVSDTFPIPEDLDVQLSSATDTDFGFSGVSERSIADLAEFYESELAAAGYVITDRQEVPDVLAVYGFERAGEVGQVAISSAPGGGTSVLVTIGDGSDRSETGVDN